MFYKIVQTTAKKENRFEITDLNGTVVYSALSPSSKLLYRKKYDGIRHITLTDASEKTMFQADAGFCGIDRKSRRAARLSAKKGFNISVIDDNEVPCTLQYYKDKTGCRGTIVYGARAAEVAFASTYNNIVIGIYDKDQKIAQITKPASVERLLDVFYVHLDDTYSDWCPLVLFFVIILDFCAYNYRETDEGGPAVLEISRTFCKKKPPFCFEWILQVFGQQEAVRFQQELELHHKRINNKFIRTVVLLLVSAMALIYIFTIVK